MLSHLLIVRNPSAKQAVITAIDLLGWSRSYIYVHICVRFNLISFYNVVSLIIYIKSEDQRTIFFVYIIIVICGFNHDEKSVHSFLALKIINTRHDAGRAVINAAESGISFPLKKRDQLLDYILTLMCRHDEEGFSDLSVELLHTQVFINAVYRYLFIINSETSS